MQSLRRTEAQARAALVSVAGYSLDLDLSLGPDTFSSSSTMRFSCHEPGATTFVDVKPSVLRSAVLNGRDLDIGRDYADGRLTLTGLAEDNELTVRADMAYSHDGEGLHRHVDPLDGNAYLYAMSFLDAAPRWFACFDQPDIKAPVELSVTCDESWTVLGNAPMARTAPGRWHGATSRPLATYFTTVVAGPYHSVIATHDGIPLGLHARASLGEHLDADAEELLAYTAACLDEFHRLFGIRYPWGEYHQAFVPEFNALAMENPGCVTFRDPFVFRSRVTDAERGRRATTIAHEMAHQWFGDLVTMRWWDDLWLNESFAEYLGHRVCDQVSRYRSWLEFGVERKAWGHAADRRPSTHPVAGNGAADAAGALADFDGISYAKGASVLRQLATHLGDDVFFAGLRTYFHAHEYGNAEFADLITAWTSAGATDLPAWADQWLRRADLDTLAVEREHEREPTALTRRAPVGDAGADRPHALKVAAFDASGTERARVHVTVDGQRTELPALPDSALVLADAADETWAKVALTAREWALLAELVSALDETARVVVWNALRLAVADAEVDPRLAVRIVAAGLPQESDAAVIGNVARWALGPLTGAYLAPAHYRESLDQFEQALAGVVRDAEPASSRQLALARAYIGATSDAELLRGWGAGEAPAGLLVDTDMRWLLLQRRCALGDATSADVDALQAIDRSSQGAVSAARCSAQLADSDSKAAAWNALVNDADRSNYELYAIAEGFWHPAQTGLTAPYVGRYFDEMPSTARIRSGWVVARTARFAYPWTAATPEALRRAEDALAGTDIDRHLRREIADGTDDLRRAVAARAAFGR